MTYNIQSAINGFTVVTQDADYQTDFYVYQNWQDVVKHISDNPLSYEQKASERGEDQKDAA